MEHLCSSKGKNSTLIWHEDLKMALLSHATSPVNLTITFVLNTALLYWLSALLTTRDKEPLKQRAKVQERDRRGKSTKEKEKGKLSGGYTRKEVQYTVESLPGDDRNPECPSYELHPSCYWGLMARDRIPPLPYPFIFTLLRSKGHISIAMFLYVLRFSRRPSDK